MLASITVRRVAPARIHALRAVTATRSISGTGSNVRTRLQIASVRPSRPYSTQGSPIPNATPPGQGPPRPDGKPSGGGGMSKFMIFVVLAAAGGVGWAYLNGSVDNLPPSKSTYQALAKDIADLVEELEYDDGSYAPVFLRLAWHLSGTYDRESKTGGSDGGTIRLNPEIKHGANAGLAIAIERLEKLKSKYPSVSYADLYTLAGVVAVKEMGGPDIKWRPGRRDKKQEDNPCPPDGRLPDASKGAAHIRDIFYRMGFNDQEIVALSGAHALGRCHTDRSGYHGPWTFSPTTFTNDYFKLLLSEKWVKKKWNGPEQYVDKSTGELMMLPTDMEIVWDKNFKKWCEAYAKDENLFFDHFAKAFSKLLELGVKMGPEILYTDVFPPQK